MPVLAESTSEPSAAQDELSLALLSIRDEASILEILPIELLINIVIFVRATSDLASLCRCCKIFRSIAQPALYRILRFMNIGKQNQRGLRSDTITDTDEEENLDAELFRNLSQTGLGGLISSLTITLSPSAACNTEIFNSQTSGVEFVCTCDDSSQLFGNALSELRVLQSLQVTCYLCDSKPDLEDRHAYLLEKDRPGPPPLVAFSMTCTCTSRTSSYITQLLSTPLITSVKALTLEVEAEGDRTDEELRKALQGDGPEGPPILSNLKTVGYNGTWYLAIIMEHRALERVGLLAFRGVGSSIWDLHACICSPSRADDGTINTLLVDDMFRMATFIATHPAPYRNLMEFGTLQFTTEPDEDVYKGLAFLSQFKKLHTIQVNRRFSSDPKVAIVNTPREFVERLGLLNDNLRYVRAFSRPGCAVDPPSTLWERRTVLCKQQGGGTDGPEELVGERQWIKYTLRSSIHTYWDVIKGRDEF